MKEHEARTTQVLLEYKAKLVEKTKHHMGWVLLLQLDAVVLYSCIFIALQRPVPTAYLLTYAAEKVSI